jgi:hypothetical protein
MIFNALFFGAVGFWLWKRFGPKRDATAGADHDEEPLYSDALPDPDDVGEGMVVMEMSVTGHVQVTDGDERWVEDLPPSPYGDGEFPEATWGVPGGPVYVVGKLYGGEDKPDHGGIYRRDVDPESGRGEWTLVHVEPEVTLHGISGTGAQNFVASGYGGVVHFHAGEFHSVKMPERIVYYCWTERDGIVVQSFYGETFLFVGRNHRHVEERERPDRDRRKFVDGSRRYYCFDRSEEVGPRTLGADEAAEIRAEIPLVRAALDAQRE